MRSIVYCGVDFSPWCSAEVFEPCGHAVEPRAVAVPGRPGAALLGGEVGVRVLRVRLYWDFMRDVDETGRADVRHAVYAALLRPGGGVLRLPGDPGVSYRDAVCTGCGSWSSLFADGVAEVEFTCFDPVGFGALRSSDAASFVVGGSWATWPVVEMVAESGEGVGVELTVPESSGVALPGFAGEFAFAYKPTNLVAGSYMPANLVASSSGFDDLAWASAHAQIDSPRSGRRTFVVSVERAFAGGEKVVLDFEGEACLVDGVDASANVSLGSEFFALSPGVCELEFAGCSAHSVSWFERWL